MKNCKNMDLQEYKKRGILFVIFCIFLQCELFAQNINFRHLGVKEGLSQVSVMSIISDNLGQMWFATRHGLNVYNGNEIRPLLMNTDEGKRGFERTRLLCTDNKEHIYFLSDEELVSFNQRFETFKSLGKDIMAINFCNDTLWACRGFDVLFYNKSTDKLELYKQIDKKGQNETVVTSVYADRKGNVYVGSERNLYKIDKDKNVQVVLSDLEIKHIFEDNNSLLWISTGNNGLYVLNDSNVVKHFMTDKYNPKTIFSNNIRCVTQDKYGNMWIGSNKGLSMFSRDTETFVNYAPDKSSVSLSHNSIVSIFCDAQGTIWIGSFIGGVDYFNPMDQIFTNININDNVDKYFTINKICPVNKNELLISSSRGLYKYDKSNGLLSKIDIPGNGSIASFAYDTVNGKIYCRTYYSGIYVYDVKKRIVTEEKIALEGEISFGNLILDMVYSENNLYVATNKGFVCYDIIRHAYKPFLSDLQLSTSTPSVMTIDSRHRLWISFLSAKILEFDLNSGKTLSHDELLPINELEQATRVYNIIEDSKERIWAITSGRGLYLYNETTKKFEKFVDSSDDITLEHALNIQEMPDGQLSILTSQGITFLNIESRTFTHLSNERFAMDRVINEGCGYYVDDNYNIMVGTLNGGIMFNYHDIAKVSVSDRLIFSRLFVDSEEIIPSEKGIISEALPYISEVNLKSGYRSFDVEVSNLDFLKSGNERIVYMLEGFDKTWSLSDKNNIHYTNITPGKYVLRVKAEYDTSEQSEMISLPIIVHPPFYATIWAIIIYIVIIATIIFFSFRIYDSKRRLRLELKYEQIEKNRIESINNERIKFYINLSHELLTPVSLIMAQIEMLVRDYKDLNGNLKQSINRIYKNADTLHLLIKEILNFRKKEYSNKDLKISQYNIIPILEDVMDSFRDKARLSGISFDLIKESQEILLFVDKEEFKKVLSNLLSNAFKYTPTGGSICVSCRSRQKKVFIDVSDTGTGIPSDKIDKIFERFYQADEGGTNEGFGIGLSYVKDVMEQHDGMVSVKNNISGGCTFTLEFKEGYGHIHQLENKEDDISDSFSVVSEQVDLKHTGDDEDIKDYTILIVEDNEEMLNLLISAFKPIYNVHYSSDVDEALALLKSCVPDIILSDVMLGNVSGIEFCSMVKRNYETCHIPFVLLTALDMEENYIAGFQNGADDYITKPFKVNSLIMKCNSLINNRKILQNKYMTSGNYDSRIVATNESDMQFVKKAETIIDNNLDNPEFGIDELSKELAMSRAKLYSKIKEVTGMTAKEFILNIKLKKAEYYLVNNEDMLISDIAYKLGFNSSRIFSQAFKDMYGETPVNYRKKKTTKA